MDDENEITPPVNQNPPVLVEYYQSVISLLAEYGWFIFIVAALAYYLWRKVLPTLEQLRSSSSVAAHKKYDSSVIEQRQLAMEARTRKLQEEHDRKAAQHAAKQAELEEKKRLERIEDWERHQRGAGYKSKTKHVEEEKPAAAAALPKSKKKLRDDEFSPLMGGSPAASCSWRPNRRGPAAGGG